MYKLELLYTSVSYRKFCAIEVDEFATSDVESTITFHSEEMPRDDLVCIVITMIVSKQQ